MNDWISVEDRLPAEPDFVWVFGTWSQSVTPHGQVGRYSLDNWWAETGYSLVVTHWMPLPDPPTDIDWHLRDDVDIDE